MSKATKGPLNGIWSHARIESDAKEPEVVLDCREHNSGPRIHLALIDPDHKLTIEERAELGRMISALPNLLEAALLRVEASRIREESISPSSSIGRTEVATMCARADELLEEACKKAINGKIPRKESEYFLQGIENEEARLRARFGHPSHRLEPSNAA